MGYPYCSSTQLHKLFYQPLFCLLTLTFALWSVFAITNNVSAAEEALQLFTTVSPISGYQVNEPFTLKTTITCPTAGCPADIIVELSPELTYIRAVSPTPADVRYDFSDRLITLIPSYSADQNTYHFELQLIAAEQNPEQQPSVRIGTADSDEIIWQSPILIPAAPPLFPSSSSEASADQPIYLQTRLESAANQNSPLAYRIAAANRLKNEPLETVTLITEFPTGVIPTKIASGWFTQQTTANPLPDLKVSYQTDSDPNWEEWGLFTNPIESQQTVLNNPPLTAGASSTGTVPISIKAIKIEIENVPAGLRWGSDQTSQPTIQLAVNPELAAEWVEICTNITIATSTDETQQLETICTSARTPTEELPSVNFNFWADMIESNPGAPQPGDRLQINPNLIVSAPYTLTQTPVDFVVELPRWLDFIDATLDPTAPGQPVFNQSVSATNGRVQLHWQWPENSQIISLTLPTIEVEVQSGVPTGLQTFPLYLLTNSPQSCWGERPFGRDIQDLDQDNDFSELICRTEAEIGVQPVSGFTADLRLTGQPTFGLPFVAGFDLINGGNQPINQINTAIRLPANWLVAPPEVPAGVAVFYSTAAPDNLCDGEADCQSANWQINPPAELNTVSAVLLTGTFKPLGPGDRATARFHLLPPLSALLDREVQPSATPTETITTTQSTEVAWPSILISGATINDDSISYQFNPPALNLDPPSAIVPLQGRAWLDTNENGVLDAAEQAQANVPLALISPSGDGEAATADDRIINWSRTNEGGFYRFGETLPGSYYVALPQTAAGFFPTQLLQTDGLETDILTAFDSVTWRTETFAVFQGEAIESKNLSLTTPDRPTLSGIIVLDQNQNDVWDDPVSAGVNSITVMLIGPDGEEIAKTRTQINGFGQPGHFVLPQPNGFLPTDLRLRMTSSAPFVGGEIAESGEYQLDFELSDQTVFNALVESPPQGVDSGDAPASYGIALHPITPDTTLGLISDSNEIESISASDIDDDTDRLDDEEGIFFTDGGTGTTADEKSEVIVVLRNQQELDQRLNGWIDFDGDGRFSEAEQIIEDFRPIPQTNPQAERFTYTIPPESACGATFARFRLGQVEGTPEGTDTSGEVEDIPYQIECVTDLAVTLGPQITPMGPNEISHWFLTVHNRGSSLAENVNFNVTIPSPVNYQGVVSLTNDPLACSDNESARLLEAVECQIAELAPGQGITLSLAYLLPFDTDARSVSSIATVSADTADSNLNNNLASRSIKVEKQWVLQDASYEAFTHVSFFPGLVTIPDNQQLDFKLDTVISTAINVPISISIGVDTNRLPRLTVPACIDSPEDATCNQTNIIEGQILQENYGIERIFFGDELIYEPEKVQIVRLNRISDPNLTRCGQSSSCVGYDLFRVGRGEIYPYAWTAPFDYFYMGFFTSGGRQVDCPETGYENRCFILQDAKPGNYDVEGFATINLVFDDTRLGNQPVIVERFIKFRTRIRVVAPFVEPESRGDE